MLYELWSKFDHGDNISDSELDILISSAEKALEYLDARKERFVSCKTRQDLETLKSFRFYRKHW